MTLEEVSRKIEQWAGVPAGLLTGETVEENIAQAKALLAYRREQTPKQPQSNEEKFSEWFNQVCGIEVQDDAQKALAEIEAQAKAEAATPDLNSPEQQFAEWLKQQMSHDHFFE